jgi:hypothetical protein
MLPPFRQTVPHRPIPRDSAKELHSSHDNFTIFRQFPSRNTLSGHENQTVHQFSYNNTLQNMFFVLFEQFSHTFHGLLLCRYFANTVLLPYFLLFLLHQSVKDGGVQRICTRYACGIIPEGLNSVSIAMVSVGKGSPSVGMDFRSPRGSSAACRRISREAANHGARRSCRVKARPPRVDVHGGDALCNGPPGRRTWRIETPGAEPPTSACRQSAPLPLEPARP